MSIKEPIQPKHVPDSGSPFFDLGQPGHVMCIGDTSAGKFFFAMEDLKKLNLPHSKPKGTHE